MAAQDDKLSLAIADQDQYTQFFPTQATTTTLSEADPENYAIEFDKVSRLYRLHHEPSLTLQDRVINLFRRNPSYEDFYALNNVSFKLEKGRTLGVIGKNGAGKSTLLKLATRILEPSSGTIRVNGRVSAMLELGTGFHPELTARENIYLNGAFYGFNRQQMEERYERIVEFSELGKFIDTPVKHFSSGMYMRLGFAIAITVSPDILIIDEVLAVGDAAFGRKCHLAIEELKSQSKAMMFVSHAAGEISRFCDEVIYLANGQIMAQGKPGEVLDEYMMDSMGPSYFSFTNGNKSSSNFPEKVRAVPVANTQVDHQSVTVKENLESKSLAKSGRAANLPYQISNGVLHRHLNEAWQFNLSHSQLEEEARALPEYCLAVFNPHPQAIGVELSGYKRSANDFDRLAGVLRVSPMGYFTVEPQQLILLQLEEGAVLNTNLLNLVATHPIAAELVEYHSLSRFQPTNSQTPNRAQPGYQLYFPFCDVRHDNQCYFEIFNPNAVNLEISINLYRDWAGPVYAVKIFQCEAHSQLTIDLKEALSGGEGERHKGERFYGAVEIVSNGPIAVERHSLQIDSPI